MLKNRTGQESNLSFRKLILKYLWNDDNLQNSVLNHFIPKCAQYSVDNLEDNASSQK